MTETAKENTMSNGDKALYAGRYEREACIRGAGKIVQTAQEVVDLAVKMETFVAASMDDREKGHRRAALDASVKLWDPRGRRDVIFDAEIILDFIMGDEPGIYKTELTADEVDAQASNRPARKKSS